MSGILQFLHYFQLMAAIPPDLKKKAKTFNNVSHELLEQGPRRPF